MSWQKWKVRLAREWLWLFFSIIGSSLLWYLVSCFYTEVWDALTRSILRLISPEGGRIIKSSYEIMAYMDAITIIFVYVLRLTAFVKRLMKSKIK